MPTRTRRRPVKVAAKPRPRRERAPRRRPGALTALLVVVAAGTVVAAVLSLRSTPTTRVSERTVTVSKGVIQTVVSGSGNLAPAKQVDVDFATSGKITKIYTKAGAHVSKGELLARIDNRSQKVDVAKAEAALVDAQDALTKAQDAEASGSTVADTSGGDADASVVAASAGGATASAGTASRGGAAASGGTTLVAYRAQATPTATPTATGTPTPSATPRGGTPSPTATPSPRASATPSATATAPSGSGAARGSGGASSSGGADSSSSGGGGSTQSVESAQAAVESAELALEDAEDALDDTVLRAPMAGTVASIANEVGDTAGSAAGGDNSGQGNASASSGSAFIVLAALSKLKLEVGLSESDIGKVEVGQSATITINAASGDKVAGHVTDVGVLASESSGTNSSAVSYPVTITLDQSTDGIKAGMSATADIVVARASGISVPSQALRGSTVTVERDGKRSTVRVQTGIVGDSSTQVLSGLEVGDKVIVTSTSALSGRTATGGAQQQTGRFGGGGFGGGFGGGGVVRAAGGGGFGGGPGGP
jgi:multidrug efflux pump subunit AcrA (membrane-fusion protein)